MTRKALILVGAVLLAAVAAQAPQANTVRRIGVLLHDGAPPGLLEAFRERLHELGHVEGKNVKQFDLIVNLKTARALELTIPPAVLLRATRIIE